jgi:hypothetical protein
MLRSSLKLPLSPALKTFFGDGNNTTLPLPSMNRFLLLQDGFKLLLQNGDGILITEAASDHEVISFSSGFSGGFA